MKSALIFSTLLLSLSSYAQGIEKMMFNLNCKVGISTPNKKISKNVDLSLNSSKTKDYFSFEGPLSLYAPEEVGIAQIDLYSFNESQESSEINLLFNSIKIESLSVIPANPLHFLISQNNNHCLISLDSSFQSSQIQDENSSSSYTLSCALTYAFVNNQKCLIDNGK